MQAVLNVPLLFVLIVLSIFLTPNVWQLAVIFGFFFWPQTARQVRGVALSVRRRDYVEAARAIGNPGWRVAVRHVLPNIVPPVMVQGTLAIAEVLMDAATSGRGD